MRRSRPGSQPPPPSSASCHGPRRAAPAPPSSRSGAASCCGAASRSLWSVQPDRSWAYTNRGLAYLAFACLGLFLGAALPRAPRRLAFLFLAGFAAAIGWALLGKAIPSLYPDYGRIARLRSPVGYWNALAQVCDAALPLGLWLGARRRWAGALVVYGASIAAVLTLSRSGLVIGVLTVVLYLALARDAYGGLLTLAASLPPAALVAGIAFTQPGLVDDGTTHSQRVHAGVVFAVVVPRGRGRRRARRAPGSRGSASRPRRAAHGSSVSRRPVRSSCSCSSSRRG